MATRRISPKLTRRRFVAAAALVSAGVLPALVVWRGILLGAEPSTDAPPPDGVFTMGPDNILTSLSVTAVESPSRFRARRPDGAMVSLLIDERTEQVYPSGHQAVVGDVVHIRGEWLGEPGSSDLLALNVYFNITRVRGAIMPAGGATATERTYVLSDDRSSKNWTIVVRPEEVDYVSDHGVQLSDAEALGFASGTGADIIGYQTGPDTVVATRIEAHSPGAD